MLVVGSCIDPSYQLLDYISHSVRILNQIVSITLLLQLGSMEHYSDLTSRNYLFEVC